MSGVDDRIEEDGISDWCVRTGVCGCRNVPGARDEAFLDGQLLRNFMAFRGERIRQRRR